MATVPTGKRAHSSLTLPLQIDYTCPFCGKKNSVQVQKEIKGMSQGTLLANDDKLKNRANEDLQKELDKFVNDAKDGNYKKLSFSVKCEGCGKKAPWANYDTLIWPICIAAMFLLCLIGVLSSLYVLIIPVVAILAFAIIFSAIRNKTIDKKVAALPEESKPKIFLVKK